MIAGVTSSLFFITPVMEYMAGGPVQWADSPAGGHPVLLVDQTRRIFRDVILGLEYRTRILHILKVFLTVL